MMRRSVAYPLLFVGFGVLSAGLLVWSARQPETVLWVEPPEPEAAESPAEEAMPEVGPEPATPEEPSPEAVPQDDGASAGGDEEPAAGEPPVPSEEELLGPLPSRAEAEPGVPEAQHALILPPRGAIAAVDPADFPSLSNRPKVWPRVVQLARPVRFPVFLNGVEAGNVLVPRGTVVALRRVLPDGRVEVAHSRSFATIPAESTDLSARVTALIQANGGRGPEGTAGANGADD